MKEKGSLNILFIGNSHTCFNDLPLLVKRRAEDGQHASPAGSDFDAKYIWETIADDLHRKGIV